MKKFFGLAALALLMCVGSNQAQARPLPLFTECKATFDVKRVEVIVGLGSGATAINCMDGEGHVYSRTVRSGLAGVALGVGEFHVRGHFHAIGAGFTWGQFLTAIASVNLGPVLNEGQQAGVGVRVNPIGIDAEVFVTAQKLSGVGIDFGSVFLDLGL